MKIKLVTDGNKWAIKKIPSPFNFFSLGAEIFDPKTGGWHFYMHGDCWMIKEIAELWFKRLTA